ncbi:hypothetical protein KM043_016340 [Ampulex compressa]|nr:hypothetical protein KM043_016340 [Ampulex compressa]
MGDTLWRACRNKSSNVRQASPVSGEIASYDVPSISRQKGRKANLFNNGPRYLNKGNARLAGSGGGGIDGGIYKSNKTVEQQLFGVSSIVEKTERKGERPGTFKLVWRQKTFTASSSRRGLTTAPKATEHVHALNGESALALSLENVIPFLAKAE